MQEDKELYNQTLAELKAKGESWAEWTAMKTMLAQKTKRQQYVHPSISKIVG